MSNNISKTNGFESVFNKLLQTLGVNNQAQTGNTGITSKSATDSSSRLTQVINANPTSGGRFRSVNLDDFLSVQKGSNAPVAIVVGNAEGTRTANGGKTKLYYGHTDPGDKKPNIGSFSYNASRGLGGATTPEAADKVELQGLNSARTKYEAKVKAAGLDPSNSLLAATFFDEHIQSPRSAGRLLRPDVLQYIKENGISPETMKEARFKSWINPETGSLYKTDKGNYEAGGFRTIAKDRLGISNPTEAQIQKVVRQDQNRRVGELVNALEKQGYAGGTGTTGGTTPTTETTPTTGTTGTTPATETTPVSTSLKFGQKGEAVKQLQDKLVKLGYLTQDQVTKGEGNFGYQTKAAVEKFQRDAGITVDGKAGKNTRNTMDAILNGVKRGDKNNVGLVKNVQNKLVELGYMTKGQIGRNSGVFGPRTQAALKKFQRDNGFNPTGNIGPKSFDALFNGKTKPVATPPVQTNPAGTTPAQTNPGTPKPTETAPVQTNPGTTADNGTVINPVTGKAGFNPATDVSSDEGGPGGYHTRGGKHGGIDIKGRAGDPVYAAHGGIVKKRQQSPTVGFGYYVDITNPKTGITSRYAHLNKASWDRLQDGSTVKAGQPFAQIGRSGNVRSNRGTHVHFEIRTGPGKFGPNDGNLDPTPYLTGKKKLPTG